MGAISITKNMCYNIYMSQQFEQDAHWLNRAHPERLDKLSLLMRRRLRRENQEYFTRLQASPNGLRIGYFGIGSPISENLRGTPFTSGFPDSAKNLFVWSPIVALEAVKDSGRLALRSPLSETVEGSILELSMADAQPDPNGSLRLVASAAATTIEQVFNEQSKFFQYIGEQALEHPDLYDGRSYNLR
jgi:hypothetical protein